MALDAYMKLTGETQGEIRGSETKQGHEDSITVNAVNHGVQIPTDKLSRLPSGKRKHEPLVVTKDIDKSTPLLMNALLNNENITKLELRFWQPGPAGQGRQFYTIELENARITDIRFEMLNNRTPENLQQRELEHISFVYQKIVWTYEDGGITAEDAVQRN
jgi:type VI secretion system secreted protein Hcp